MPNDTDTLTLTDFLLARIEEDADNAADCGGMAGCEVPDAILDRNLAECEAKRRIVEAYRLAPIDALLAVLLLMAEVYADHPDYRWRLTYREEWR